MTGMSLEFIHFVQNFGNRPHSALNVRFVGLPAANTDAHRSKAPPRRTAKERFACGIDCFDHLICAAVVIFFIGIWLGLRKRTGP